MPRTTPFWKPLGLLLTAALLVAAAAPVWAAPTAADDALRTRSKAPPASYSTGQQGSKLKWLPHRPSKPRVDDRVIQAQHLVPVTQKARVWTARQSKLSPFDDPFGDGHRRAKPQPVAPPRTLDDDALNKAAAGPLFADADLQFPGEQPAASPGDQPTATPETEPARLRWKELEPGSAAAEKAEFEEAAEEVPTFEEGPEGIRALEDRSQTGRALLQGECPSPRDEEFFTPIAELSTDTSVQGDQQKPASQRAMPRECNLSDESLDPEALRPWCPTTFTWKAAGLCHKPLYFEDVHLERYGHSSGPYLQPIISGAHFFLTVPVLPYQMALCPPEECEYTLGYYRPGNCAPYLIDPLPISIRAGLAEAGVWTGLIFLIP